MTRSFFLLFCFMIPLLSWSQDNIPASEVNIPGFMPYQEAILPDPTAMNLQTTSMELSKALKIGFNVGNTFEAIYKHPDGRLSGDETTWGNPTPNAALFRGIKAAGFNFVRMPVSYSHQLTGSNSFEIKKEWLDKVAKAVDDAIEAGLYIMINIHWDGGWMDHPNDRHKDAIYERFEAYWKQIALRFRNYDEHLLFAGMNEVADAETDMWNVHPTAENLRVHNSLNQLFVNTVRATGGRNYYRYLVLPSYLTNIGYAVSGFEHPEDVVDNRTFLECHFYDPFEFCLSTENYKTEWGKPFADAGYDVPNWGMEEELDETLRSLQKFTDRNIPVMIGEWGAIARMRGELSGKALERHIDARNYYYWYITRTCLKYDLLPVNWDIGLMFNRKTGEQYEVSNIAAIMKAVAEEQYLPVTIAQDLSISGPDNNLKVNLQLKNGNLLYSVIYKEKTILEESPLGLLTNIGDFSKALSLVGSEKGNVEESYTLDRIKQSRIHYSANQLIVKLANADMHPMNVIFQVSNNDIAFRYEIPKKGETASMIILKEATGFALPGNATTFLTPQSDPMIGWKRTKPSYEEVYQVDVPLTERSQYGKGFTFPALFRIGDNGWALISETGVDSKYCASRLSDVTPDGLYTLEFPMPGENNGNGTTTPGIALPGNTPWRTVTVADNLKPIVETTIPWDVVKPLYETAHSYHYGRGTWSWIMWQDESINYEDQVHYIDLASSLGYEYVLIDNWWDVNIGYDRMQELIRYAHSKNVDIFLWYSSSGYWNDIAQSPLNIMDHAIARKKEMKWLEKSGVKGIKVDFFGGDKQETMRLYEEILSDADDHGLMVIFHGCTLPRGWERMYPNYVGSEAVLASENLIFSQHMNDMEAINATLHPFIRNAVGCMEFGGTLLNKRYNRTNDGGSIRKTTDAFQLATAVLFQNPVQFFALAPNNLTDAPTDAIEFMKDVPTTWDETVFLDGYPGKYCVLARRHQDNWYIVGVNAQKDPLKLTLTLPMFSKGDKVVYYTDNKQRQLTVKETVMKEPAKIPIVIQPEGGIILYKTTKK